MDRCTGRRHVTEILLNTAINTIQSISQHYLSCGLFDLTLINFVYIYLGHLHQVRSHGRGISYTVQFAPSTDFDSSDCKKEVDESKGKRKKKDKKQKEEEKEKEAKEEKEKEVKLSLADVKFLWTYKDGERVGYD